MCHRIRLGISFMMHDLSEKIHTFQIVNTPRFFCVNVHEVKKNCSKCSSEIKMFMFIVCVLDIDEKNVCCFLGTSNHLNNVLGLVHVKHVNVSLHESCSVLGYSLCHAYSWNLTSTAFYMCCPKSFSEHYGFSAIVDKKNVLCCFTRNFSIAPNEIIFMLKMLQ
jgi:hypothetical protein